MSALEKLGSRWKAKWENWFHSFAQGSKIFYLQENLRQSQITNDWLMSIWLQSRSPHSNPLTRHGRKFFSQSDEDGILLEILRRLGLEAGTCVEIGCGNGLENNTLILLTQGWRTVWFDATELAFDARCNPEILAHSREFITAENVVALVSVGLESVGSNAVDVLSIDIDGNDAYVAEALLGGGFRPSVLVIETNEVIPPPIEFKQPYTPGYVWDKSKNTGVSLQSLANLLEPLGYSCVGCNLETGVNAFFVRSDLRGFFADVPTDLNSLYVGRSIHPLKYRDRRTEVNADLISSLVRAVAPRQ